MLKEKSIKYVLLTISFVLMLSMLLGLVFNGLTIAMADDLNTHTEVEINMHETHNESCTYNLNSKNVEIGKVENVLGAELENLPTGDTTNPNDCAKCDCAIYACSVCWTKTADTLKGGGAIFTPNSTHANFEGDNENHNLCSNNIINQDWYKSISKVIDIVDSMLVPILVVIGTAGTIFVIVLGVNYSKAESADKREEAKKRMISAIIGVVIMIVLLVVIKLFTANAYSIMKFINNQ